jgi:hypothetical protein
MPVFPQESKIVEKLHLHEFSIIFMLTFIHPRTVRVSLNRCGSLKSVITSIFSMKCCSTARQKNVISRASALREHMPNETEELGGKRHALSWQPQGMCSAR